MSNEATKKDDKDNARENAGQVEPRQDDSNFNQELVMDYSILFICKICKFSCSDKSGMLLHLQTHRGSKVYECKDCQRSFDNVEDFYHLMLHEEKTWKCSKCEKTFQKPSNLANHLFSHDYEKLYQCPNCEFFANNACSIKRHLQTHTDAIFKCFICGKTYGNKFNLNDHYRLGCQDEEFKCTSCDKTFSNSKCLNIHMASCRGCKNKFNHQSNVTEGAPTIPSSVRCSSEEDTFSGRVNQFVPGTSYSSGPEIACSPSTVEHTHNLREVKNVPRTLNSSEKRSSPGNEEVPVLRSTTLDISGCETELGNGTLGGSSKFIGTNTFDETSSLTISPSRSECVDDSSFQPMSAIDDLEDLSSEDLSSAPWARSALEPYIEILHEENTFSPEASSFPRE